MNEFQAILLIVTLIIFSIFFKQIFSGNFPERGVDYEAKRDNTRIGSISTPENSFKDNSPKAKINSRVDKLFEIAQKSLDSGDNEEAEKALESLLIIDKNNTDAFRMLGVALMNMNNYTRAKEVYNELLTIDKSDDLAYSLLANAEHKLGEDSSAIEHHKKAIELDDSFAKHYFNYANTLYDLEKYQEAKELYEKAYLLDDRLTQAQDMIKRIDSERS